MRGGEKLARGFTLIELLTVVGIIGLLISILMPSLARAREQAKSVHCRARLHDIAVGLQSYANTYRDLFPPALWNADYTDPQHPTQHAQYQYGWQELLWSHIYKESIWEPIDFPVQRNINGRKWETYFLCKSSRYQDEHSGHYRVYLPSWSFGTYNVAERQPWLLYDPQKKTANYPDPRAPSSYSSLRPKLILIGDSNERSYRGNGSLTNEDTNGDQHDDNDCSFIDAAEANESGPSGWDGNRFSDRHYGYTNFLYADWHSESDDKLREELARDWNYDGIDDVQESPGPGH